MKTLHSNQEQNEDELNFIFNMKNTTEDSASLKAWNTDNDAEWDRVAAEEMANMLFTEYMNLYHKYN